MSLKTILLFTATGTIGATLTSPHLSSIFVEFQKKEIIGDFEKGEKITEAVYDNISLTEEELKEEEKRKAKEKKLEGIAFIYQRIKRWVNSNGNCRIVLVISSTKNTSFPLIFDDLANNSEDSIFKITTSLGKSKFEKLAEDLETRSSSEENYKKYLEGFSGRCSSHSELKLQWRDSIKEHELPEENEKEYLRNLVNLWVEEDILKTSTLK